MATRKPVFDDGSPADRSGGRRGNPRKTAQLCAQVRRALDLALLGDVEDPVIQDLVVESVEPTADDSRLFALFAAGTEAGALEKAEVLTRLESQRPVLIRAVAEAIHRRKVPEIAFDVMRRVDG